MRLGILGGGQLGRMLALAGANLGITVHVLDPAPGGPAAQVAPAETVASYEDLTALDAFAASVDVVTYEFENVPADTVRHLAKRVPVQPGVSALETAQDRLLEKRFANGLAIPTAPFVPVDGPGDLVRALAEIGTPAILKTRRFGYDGKGQAQIEAAGPAAAEAAWRDIGAAPAVLEGLVGFEREISVIAARDGEGRIACYDQVENVHRHHILHTSTAPAALASKVAVRAREIAGLLLDGLDYVGVMGVELFHLADGGLLLNEIAPRVHNSGHWTIEGAETSQFEQHVRAVTGLPLGPTTSLGRAEMTNLIGDDVATVPALLAEPGAHVHLYGKAEGRPGRKMGHVTRVRRE